MFRQSGFEHSWVVSAVIRAASSAEALRNQPRFFAEDFAVHRAQHNETDVETSECDGAETMRCES